MPENLDPLFPEIPEDLPSLSDDDLSALLADHDEARKMIAADDEEFLKGLSGDEIIEQYKIGADQIKTLRAEQEARVERHQAFVDAKAAIDAELDAEPVKAEDEPAPDDPSEPDPDDDDGAVSETPAVVEEPVLVTASAETPEETTAPVVRFQRKPPAAPPERIVVQKQEELSFVASGLLPSTPPGQKLETSKHLTDAIKDMAFALGPADHHREGREVKHLVAKLDQSPNFPPERTLDAKDWQSNADKIAQAVGSPFFGKTGLETLLASGGLCAPLTPIYSIPQLATDATPVEDALPFMAATRGGINVPTPGTLVDATDAITTITEANDALGGTFATKACLDTTCPTYTETAVTIISACREFGNLNAMAWPEFIQNQLELTRAMHARTSEQYLLEQIKALSINVTSGAATLSALSYLVDAIAKSMFGIRGRLRLPREARFVALLPAVILDMLLVDTIQTIDGNRFRTRAQLDDYLRSTGIDPVYYLDGDFAAGDDMIPDAAQAAGALESWPNTFQWAIFPQGTFLGLAMPDLNLGIVRDSTLNSTNDFQIFWERFLNVARIGPAQAAYWNTTTLCAVGEFPPAGTARTCES